MLIFPYLYVIILKCIVEICSCENIFRGGGLTALIITIVIFITAALVSGGNSPIGAVLSVAVTLLLFKILGVSDMMLTTGIIAFVILVVFILAVIFLFFCVCLIFSSGCKAEFTRIDKAPKGNYKVAYYSVDGQEYPCIFPSEVVLNDKMYRKGRTYNVMLNKRMKRVYDVWTIITCIIGLVFSSFVIMVIIECYFLFKEG